MADSVSIRPLLDTDDDYSLMVRWLADRRVLEWVFGRDETYTLARVREEWNPQLLAVQHLWPYLIELDGTPIGYLQLVWVHAHAEGYGLAGDPGGTEHAYAFDLWIGEPEQWGRGLGTAACHAAIAALRARGAQRILIDPRVMNERAVHVYTKVGFRTVKVLPGNELHEGIGWDCWLMELGP